MNALVIVAVALYLLGFTGSLGALITDKDVDTVGMVVLSIVWPATLVGLLMATLIRQLDRP